MKITVISVGKLKEKYLKDGIAEYCKRLTRFCDIEMIEVPDEQAPEKLSMLEEEQLKKREGDKIRKKIREGSAIIALDIKGKELNSEELAEKLNSFFISGKSSIVFIIGGSLGLDEQILKQSDFRLSFSKMTFPHQLARLMLVEQVYRTFKINNGETYHK